MAVRFDCYNCGLDQIWDRRKTIPDDFLVDESELGLAALRGQEFEITDPFWTRDKGKRIIDYRPSCILRLELDSVAQETARRATDQNRSGKE